MLKPIFSRIRNRRGQVAIFIALIFQVLFLFFAMIINVGLLVHHKINLQNSADLAAYYGAMKQAEMMNAIGHVNYQIRQSWKLLAWRYRQLGTAGDFKLHPYNKLTKKIEGDIEGLPVGASASAKQYYDAPPFCIAYAPFAPLPSKTESTCKDQSQLTKIVLFNPPPVIAGFYNFNKSLNEASTIAIKETISRCRIVGPFNYMVLAEFIAAYNIDQAERKQLINMLSRGLSEKSDDFRDIDGELASEGIINTFKNNLTEANRNSIKDNQIKIINGLGQNDCNGVGQINTDPAKWLSEVKVKPAYSYLDFTCGSGNPPEVVPDPKELNTKNLPNYVNDIDDAKMTDRIKSLSQFADPLQAPYNSSLGVEKNPWCMAYVGVSAQTTPNIPFAPLGGVTLKAKSFAKPFGGKIGPWYYSQWPRGSNQSSGGKRLDPLLPWREGDSTNQADPQDPTRIANYSRYPGDPAGMKSKVVQGQFGRAIYNLSTDWSQKPPNPIIDGSLPANFSKSVEPNFDHWQHLGIDFKIEKSGDILAWDTNTDTYPRMRDLELMAILPDLFDITYYSIEPDFYHNYYLKIANNYVKKVPGFTYLVRPDLGARLNSNDKKLSEYSIRDQYARYEKVKANDPQINEPKVEFDTKLRYVATSVYQSLTSWAGKDLMDYSLDEEKFGKCTSTKEDLEKGGPTSGDCINGGRTGYSVKMVSSDYLRAQDLDLGGEGGAVGPILNPPDKDF